MALTKQRLNKIIGRALDGYALQLSLEDETGEHRVWDWHVDQSDLTNFIEDYRGRGNHEADIHVDAVILHSQIVDLWTGKPILAEGTAQTYHLSLKASGTGRAMILYASVLAGNEQEAR